MSKTRQPVTQPAIARTNIEDAERAPATSGERSKNVLLHRAEGACPYRPLIAIAARDVLVRQVEIVRRFCTAAPFGCADKFILRDEATEMIGLFWCEREPDAVLVLRYGRASGTHTLTGTCSSCRGHIRKRGPTSPARERDHAFWLQFFVLRDCFLLRRDHLDTFSRQSKERLTEARRVGSGTSMFFKRYFIARARLRMIMGLFFQNEAACDRQ